MANINTKYKELTDREHVLTRPGMYIGDTSLDKINCYVYNPTTQKRELENLEISPAVLKLFDEVLSNSIDESKRAGSKLDNIKVEFNKSTGEIIIFDNGGMPVEKLDSGLYVPELCFSKLRAGSNFDDSKDRTWVGTNGLGSTLVNIFSVKFTVETCDAKNLFIKSWSDNMSKSEDAHLTKTKQHYTKISFIPDYEKLDKNWKLHIDNYDKVFIERCEHAAISTKKLKIEYNNSKINLSFNDYIKSVDEDIIHIENKDKNSEWEVFVGSSGKDISIVNGAVTNQGGSHVRYMRNKIVECLMNDRVIKSTKIPESVLSNNITIYLSAIVANPTYSSQTKERLTSPVSSFVNPITTIPSSVIKSLRESNLLQNIIESYESKLDKKLNKSVSSKNISIPKLVDADMKCKDLKEFWIFEGDSAAGGFYANRKPNQGCIPVKGKVLNCRGLKLHKALQNKEINDIFTALGLIGKSNSDIFNYTNSEKIDITLSDGCILSIHCDSEVIYNNQIYSISKFKKLLKSINEPINLNSIIEVRRVDSCNLRYDYVVISSDADIDGDAICGLLLNLFHEYYPDLLVQGRVYRAVTPLLTCEINKKKRVFYSLKEFNEVFKSDGSKIKHIEYKKGLGSLSNEEFRDMLHNTYRCYFYSLGDKVFEDWWGDNVDARKLYISNGIK